jgi:pimeloyl-ACP methyl ester carboxylesterase
MHSLLATRGRHDAIRMLHVADTPEPRVVRTAGERVVGYYEFGDPLGTPVVALHGTPACGAGFAWADDRARARGIRLLAPDRPGVGISDRWVAGSGATVEAYGAELRAFAEALELPTFSVIGYSGGGPYALAAAHALADCVNAVAVVSGSGQVGEWASINDFETTDRLLTRLSLHLPVVARAVLDVGALASRVAPKTSLWFGQIEMSAPDRAVMAEFPSARAALAMFTQSCDHGARGVVDDYAALGRPWGFAVEEITVPVQCWHATTDPIVPLHHTDELVRRIPGAQVTHWDGGGHLAIIDRIDEVFDALLVASS